MANKADEQYPTEQQRRASALLEADLAKIAAKRKENSRLRLEAFLKERGPLPPPPTRAELEQKLADAKKRHESLGGSNWQYADRDQNMTPGEREARKLESTILDLNRQLRQTPSPSEGNGYAKGGKIDLKGCGVSTAPKGKRNRAW